MELRRILPALLLCALVFRTVLPAQDNPIYPLPHKLELGSGTLDLEGCTIRFGNGPRCELSALAERLSSELAARYRVSVPVKPEASGRSIVLGLLSDPVIQRSLPGIPGDSVWYLPEGYRLAVTPSGAVIAGHDLSGLYYGIQSFLQLVSADSKGEAKARVATVTDAPAKPFRGVHVYLPAREDLQFFKNYIRTMAHYKINTMILEVGGGMRLDRHPEINLAWEHFCRSFYDMGDLMLKYGEQTPLGPQGRFQASVHTELAGGSWLSKDEVREIVECARENCMEVIPEIQSLTHCYYLALAHRDIAEIPEAAWPDSYDPTNPKSYELLFDVIDEYLDVIQPRRVHIGHDEWRSGVKGVPGINYGRDVLKIYSYLRSRGVGTLMWGDHMISGHNMDGNVPPPPTKPGEVWYAYPSTKEAPGIVSAKAKDILMLNWSWGVTPTSYDQLASRGWKQVLGNFSAANQYDKWPEIFRREDVLGAEMSTWCRADEFSYGQNGAVLNMLASENLLWGGAQLSLERLFALMSARMVQVRQELNGLALPSQEAAAGRPGYSFVSLDLSAAGNAAPGKMGEADLSRVKAGKYESGGVPFAVAAGEKALAAALEPGQAVSGIAVGSNAASLLFLQVATGSEESTNTYQSNYPHDTAPLVGFYRVHYADGLEESVPIRYGRNIARWDGAYTDQVYYARTVNLGQDKAGKPVLAWAMEWVCPRPNRKIQSVDLVAAGASKARPVLLGLTLVKPPFEQ